MKKHIVIAVSLLLSTTCAKAQIITTVAGTGVFGFSGDNGEATAAQITNAAGMAFDWAGNIFFADPDSHTVREVFEGNMSTVVGDGIPGDAGDFGAVADATLTTPVSITVDASGNMYIADIGTASIRQINLGIITTYLSTPDVRKPTGVAIDAGGTMYFSDAILNIVGKTGFGGVTVLAGLTTAGYSGDGGLATNALLNSPNGVAVDGAGNVYINDSARIRKIDLSGIITTIAGTGTLGYSGDGGPATAAKINQSGMAVDAAGNVYIAEAANQRIRKVSTSGIITTIAGNGTRGYAGDGGPATAAELNEPASVAIDGAGNLYIGDGDHRIRRVSTVPNSVPAITPAMVSAYPNPTKEEVYISGIANNTGYQLLDMTGVCVAKGVLQKNDCTISMMPFAAGTYVLQLNGNNGERNFLTVVKE